MSINFFQGVDKNLKDGFLGVMNSGLWVDVFEFLPKKTDVAIVCKIWNEHFCLTMGQEIKKMVKEDSSLKIYQGIVEEADRTESHREKYNVLKKIPKLIERSGANIGLSSSFGTSMKENMNMTRFAMNMIMPLSFSTLEKQFKQKSNRNLEKIFKKIKKSLLKKIKKETEKKIIEKIKSMPEKATDIQKWIEKYNNESVIEKVIKLNLSNMTSMKNLPSELFSFAFLKELDISCHNFILIPEEFGKFSNLKILNLSHNQLQNIANLCSVISLEILDVSFNKIYYLPKDIVRLEKLKEFNISNNSITEFPRTIKFLELETFDISNNLTKSIESFPLEMNIPKLKNFILDEKQQDIFQRIRRLIKKKRN